MNIFVIHSGSDETSVSNLLNSFKRKSFYLNALVLKNGNCFWKVEAKRKIKKAQAVLFCVGEKSHESPYIGWEIKTAKALGKPIFTIRLKADNKLHNELFIKNSFTDDRIRYDKDVSEDDFIDIVNHFESGDYAVFNQTLENMDPSILLEQYKIFLQTSEDLVSRRQSVNNFYISLNTALVALFGATVSFDIFDNVKTLICIFFTIIGIVLSISWIKLLISYGNLNSSKMKIISCIEKRLAVSLYDAEWAALSDKLNKKKYVSFTNNEKSVPLIFIFLYIGLLISSLILTII